MSYANFINTKQSICKATGFIADELEYPKLTKDHQRVSITWACKRGKAALFFGTGLGKTLAQITWADQIVRRVGGRVLILAPLAVSYQTVLEGVKFGVGVNYAKDTNDVISDGIYVTNYEKLHNFDTSLFIGVVLDESSILKGMNGKFRQMLSILFKDTPYKLSCTATPSPNDYMELGTQAEFLGIMSQVEMLAMFFVHDGSDTSKWRLKGHGRLKFWKWLSTWAIFLQSPEDLGFDGSEYELPPITYHDYVIKTEPVIGSGSLFIEVAQTLLERNKARKDSIISRCSKASEIVKTLKSPVVIWCHRNDESSLLLDLIPGSVEVKGGDSDSHKANSMLDFAKGKIDVLITKPSIAGFGMNWQSSHNSIFVGLSDSWEALYQAIRRQWRFGQLQGVNVHIISADTEGAVVANIKRKDKQHNEMMFEMLRHTIDLTKKNVLGAVTEKTEYAPDIKICIPEWLTAN